MPLPLQNFFDSLPLFWRLATVRLIIYIFVVGVNEWFASIEGFTSETDMTPLEIEKMHMRIAVVMATTLIAFLDSGLSAIQKSGTLSSADVRAILSEMTPGSTVTQTAQTTTAVSPPETK